MKEKWKNRLKQIWAKRPRMSRGLRTVINLAIIVVILLYIWGLAGYPLFFPTLEFRRLERQYLMPKSEIVFSATPKPFYSGVELELDGETVDLRGTWRVGASENWAAIMGSDNSNYLYRYPRGDGPDPVPMAMGYLLAYHRGQGFTSYLPLLFLDVPRGTAWTEVEMDIPSEGKTYHRAGGGTNQGNATACGCSAWRPRKRVPGATGGMTGRPTPSGHTPGTEASRVSGKEPSQMKDKKKLSRLARERGCAVCRVEKPRNRAVPGFS